MEDYRKKLKGQTVVLWILLALALALNVVVGIMWDEWFLDPRRMTMLARRVQSMAYFGFLACLIVCIVRNRKLLREQEKLADQERKEKDERRRFVSGMAERLSAQIFTVMLAASVFAASLLDMTAFGVLMGVLAVYAALRIGSYLYYGRKY